MEDLKLDDILKYVRSGEAAKLHISTVSGSASTSAAVNSLRSSSSLLQEVECFNCGAGGHIAGDDSCPAKGKNCRSCEKCGHFANSREQGYLGACVAKLQENGRHEWAEYYIPSP